LSKIRHFRLNTLYDDLPLNYRPVDLEYAKKLTALSAEHCNCYEPHRETKLRLISIDMGPWADIYSIKTRRNLIPIVTKLSPEAEVESESELDLFGMGWSD
jgi:hypothetical protein